MDWCCMSEEITDAAILVADMVHTLPRPARHHDIINDLVQWKLSFMEAISLNAVQLRVNPHTQGFLTSEGRFVDRREAKQIALAANQLDLNDMGNSELLFTEDLW